MPLTVQFYSFIGNKTAESYMKTVYASMMMMMTVMTMKRPTTPKTNTMMPMTRPTTMMNER
eukprot:5248463-Karenia_brevis.AAC.1